MQVLKRYDAYFVTEQDVRDAEKMKPGLPGAYQLENAATAKKAAEIFLPRHVKTRGDREVIGRRGAGSKCGLERTYGNSSGITISYGGWCAQQ